METLKKVDGIWHGSYSYDEQEHMPTLPAVPFSLTLKQGWLGRFTGIVVEEEPHGLPGTGNIDGRLVFPQIEFTKQMPVCYVMMPDGRRITLRESLIEEGMVCERDVPHMPIYYQGEFADVHRAVGKWIMRAGPLALPDGRTIPIPQATGIWAIDKLDF